MTLHESIGQLPMAEKSGHEKISLINKKHYIVIIYY
jgi:hypothetical protein